MIPTGAGGLDGVRTGEQWKCSLTEKQIGYCVEVGWGQEVRSNRRRRLSSDTAPGLPLLLELPNLPSVPVDTPVESKPMPSSHYQTEFDKKDRSGRLSFPLNAVILRRHAD